MNPIRIAVIIQRYLPLIGGMESQTHAQICRLPQEAFEMHVITRRHANLPAYEVMDGIHVHRVPIFGPKITTSLSYTLGALALLRRLHPDILHANELLSASLIGALAKRFWGWPLLITPHRGGPIGDVQRLHQKLFGAQRMAAFATLADRFIAISEEIGDELIGAGAPPERLTHIPNGVNIRHFQPPDETRRAALRERLKLPLDSLVVVFSGRLAPEKRVNFLVQAWPTVRATFPQARLLILGEGSERPSLEAAAGEGIRFVGYVDNVADYLAASDLFVLPSIAEGISGAMLEAMSSGLPVLVTSVGAAPQVITHGENGWLIPPDEPQAVQQALLHLLSDVALRQKMGRAARRHIEEHYALDKIAMRLEQVYRQVFTLTPRTHGEKA